VVKRQNVPWPGIRAGWSKRAERTLSFYQGINPVFHLGVPGSARIDLLPQTRGPNSIRPCDKAK